MKRGNTIIILLSGGDKSTQAKDIQTAKRLAKNGEKEMPKKAKREKITAYDPAEDLGSNEAIAIFMAEAFQTNDAGYIAHALGVVARAKGMAQIASQTGLSREQLYRSFSEKGNPTLKTTLTVMKALGIKFTAKIPSAA
jgi:probable addiction module antidote protein